MHNRWTRLLPLFIAALWLPFQAIAATAMPFCRHGEAHKTTSMTEDKAVEHCAMHEAQPAPTGHGLNCDDCGVCHLLAAGFIPTAEQSAAAVSAARDFRTDAPLVPASAIPEPPQQPPKRLA